MKKIITIIMALTVIMSTFVFATGQQQPGVSTAAGPVKLTVALTEDLKILDYKTNLQTRLIERGTNTDLDFVLFPLPDYIAKLNLMVMAGGSELPDIILASPGDAMVYQWAREGAILPLKKYYDNPSLSANVRAAVSQASTDFVKEVVSPDGELYGLPAYGETWPNSYPVKFLYYKPWVDKLGIKVPTTLDETRTFLHAITTMDPNGNGRADEVAMTGTFRAISPGNCGGWFHFLMTPFIYVSGSNNLLNVNNGTLSVPYNTEAWKAGLKYIRSLFADGLLPLENLTQDMNQVNTLCNSDPVRVGSLFRTSSSNMSSNQRQEDYQFAPPLIAANGNQYSAYIQPTAEIAFMISANCKNPESAFRVGDYLMREDISLISRYGEQGVQWDYARDVRNLSGYASLVEGFEPFYIVYDDATFWGGSTIFNACWRGRGNIFTSVKHMAQLFPSETVVGFRVNAGKAYAMYTPEAFRPNQIVGKLIYNENEMTAISDLEPTLLSYVHEMTSHFLAGNRDIDTSWNAYLAELNTIGIGRYLSTVQGVYDRMFK